jgi:hypothetical protein
MMPLRPRAQSAQKDKKSAAVASDILAVSASQSTSSSQWRRRVAGSSRCIALILDSPSGLSTTNWASRLPRSPLEALLKPQVGLYVFRPSRTIGCARFSDSLPRFATRRHHYHIRYCRTLGNASKKSNSRCASAILCVHL